MTGDVDEHGTPDRMRAALLRRVGRGAWCLYRAPLFSPAGFVVRALILTVLFAALHLAGLRAWVGILSGSLAAGRLPDTASGALGIVYLCAYVAQVVLVPILLIGAALFAAANRGTACRTVGRNPRTTVLCCPPICGRPTPPSPGPARSR